MARNLKKADYRHAFSSRFKTMLCLWRFDSVEPPSQSSLFPITCLSKFTSAFLSADCRDFAILLYFVTKLGRVGDCEELKPRRTKEPHLSMNESPTKQGQLERWLWTTFASIYVVFAIFVSREGTVLRKLLGDSLSRPDTSNTSVQRLRLSWSLVSTTQLSFFGR